MRELMRTNDLVVLSFAEVVLRQADIEPLVMDANISVMEGSIGMFPRRLMLIEDDADEARRLLSDAGLAEWLIDL